MRKMPKMEVDPAVAELEARLADVARSIARLLTQPRYDEAELADLDGRAEELRRQLVEARPPQPDYDGYGGPRPLLSGG
ncbi:MAG TPA: hypothetical protein VFJ82_02105 [Longimicrobium sp.]|nr:hypothetical protein [Longimicrobium sp.]